MEIDYVLTYIRSDKGKDVVIIDADNSKVVDLDRSNAANPTKASQSKTNPIVDSGKYEKDNKTICVHLLNYMNDSLFNLFMVQKLAKTIWETLEYRYEGKNTLSVNGYNSR